MGERIDAHHHLWRYSKQEYAWIEGKMTAALARDFLPPDLEKETAACGIQGTIAVQARQSLEETKWILDLSGESNLIRGVVGWAPIASPEFPSILERLQPFDKLKGLRHVIQDEPDEEFILGADFNDGIARLQNYSLVYDILIFERHLPAAIRFVDRHPHQIFVLDHIAKPRIRDRKLEPWSANIRELARRENVYCKVSGMITEADWANWSENDLRPYFDTVLEAFGANRLMAGSDWPVCTLAGSYHRWNSALREMLRPLSSDDQEMILGDVASSVYGLRQSKSAQEKSA
jgi:L-fuconolactonase